MRNVFCVAGVENDEMLVFLKNAFVFLYLFFEQAPDVGKLTGLGEALEKDGIKHKVWIEQPENVPTCIALKPYKKEEVHKYVKKFKLLS